MKVNKLHKAQELMGGLTQEQIDAMKAEAQAAVDEYTASLAAAQSVLDWVCSLSPAPGE